MAINDPSDISADLQIGPTSAGMVRIFIVSGEFELPMDFSPEEAEEIADELRAAAQFARQSEAKGGRKSRTPKN